MLVGIMKIALLALLFTISAIKSRCNAQQFQPTPIPLHWSDEQQDERESRAIKHVPPPHEWEDKLRHSVYLALVRDKMDQLIARSIRELNLEAIDDRDLWDKIKNAPFDRVTPAEEVADEDVADISSGRLLEEPNGFRFSENIANTNICTGEGCTHKNVKALWTVKRVRHLDNKAGHYHYELTFSVISDPDKKQERKQSNPRTFVVNENGKVVKAIDKLPQVKKSLWFHKNIEPVDWKQSRSYESDKTNQGGELIGETARMMFSALFDDDEGYKKVERPHPPHHGKIKVPVEKQYNKPPYLYKNHAPQMQKQSRPHIPLATHHYLDIDAIGVVSNPYLPEKHKGKSLNSTALPKLIVVAPPKNFSKYAPTTEPQTNTMKEKPVQIQYTYVKQVRPPQMYGGPHYPPEKKPFKPLPPLKHHYVPKPHKPIDFKPSPQLLDIQFSEPDPLLDSVFRPIMPNFQYNDTDVAQSSKKVESYAEKAPEIVTAGPTAENTENIEVKVRTELKNVEKKPDVVEEMTTAKSEKMTTAKSEEIYTTTEYVEILRESTTETPIEPTTDYVQATTESHKRRKKSRPVRKYSTIATTSVDESILDVDLSWTKLLGNFVDETKTTPETKTREPEYFTTEKIKAVVTTEAAVPTERITETIIEPTTITPAPKPQHKRGKKNKKRLTSTTPKPDEEITKNTLVTHATVTAPITKASETTTKETVTARLTTSTTTSTTTTSPPPPEESRTSKQGVTTKSKNRYRQSTLLTKGTSVKHDKWSNLNNIEAVKLQPKPSVSQQLSKYQTRRQESNFQGYNTSPSSNAYDSVEPDEKLAPIVTTTSSQENKIKELESKKENAVNSSDMIAESSSAALSESYSRPNKSKYRPSNIFSLKAIEEDETKDNSNKVEQKEEVDSRDKPKTPIKVCKKKKSNSTTTSTTSTTVQSTTFLNNFVDQDVAEDTLDEDEAFDAFEEDVTEDIPTVDTQVSTINNDKTSTSITQNDSVESTTEQITTYRGIFSFDDFFETTTASDYPSDEPLYNDFGDTNFFELIAME